MKGIRSLVLCVEDDPDTREMLGAMIETQGYRFEAVDNCADALNLLRGGDVSLMLLDNRLPDGTGIDLCKKVRRFDKELPIVFLSGSALETDRELALEAGANAFLTKPVALEALFQTLTRWSPAPTDLA